MTLALDISYFTYSTSGELTQSQLQDAWNSGVRLFRPSIAVQEIAVQQIDAIVDYGEATGNKFIIEPYRYYYFDRWVEQVETDKAFIQRVRDLKYDIQKFSIDIEDTNELFSPQQRIEETSRIIDSYEGFCPTDYYTGRWYHMSYMDNTTRFNFMPLWYARYGKTNNDLTNPPTLDVDFGGWTKARMHQYVGDVYFAGIWCDMNYYEESIVTPPTPPTEPEIVTLNVNPNKLYRFNIS